MKKSHLNRVLKFNDNFTYKLLLLFSSTFSIHFAQGACNQTLNAGANIANAVSAAASGSTICLNAGSYPGFNANIVKSSMTTVTAAPGLARSQVTISAVNTNASQNLALLE